MRFDGHVEVEPGVIVSMIRFVGLARGSGIKIDQPSTDVHWYQGGCLVSQTFYWDPAEAFESVGIRPPGSRR